MLTVPSSFGSKPKAKSPQALFLLANRRSEYSDETDKLNKKEDLLLSKQLKVLDRQERVANNILKKHRREAERLQKTVTDRSQQSMNLRQYDSFRYTRTDNVPEGGSLAGVQLPPLWPLAESVQVSGSTSSETRKRKPRFLPRDTHAMMSMRALKTGVPDNTGDKHDFPMATASDLGSTTDRRWHKKHRASQVHDASGALSHRTLWSLRTV